MKTQACDYQFLAVKTLLLSVLGLSTMPFWAVVLQFIDKNNGFSGGRGYYSDFKWYLLKEPLIYVEIVLLIYIVFSGIYLLLTRVRKAESYD